MSADTTVRQGGEALRRALAAGILSNKMTNAQRLQSIHDLASARLRNGPLERNVEHDLKQIVELAEPPAGPGHYPDGMGEESCRLHREYMRLEAEQLAGAKNAPEVRLLIDECEAKGIVIAQGGERL